MRGAVGARGSRLGRVPLLALLVLPLLALGGQAPAASPWRSVELARGWGAHPGGLATHGEAVHLALRHGRDGAWRGLAYARCEQHCEDHRQWRLTPLPVTGLTHPAVRVDSRGRPHLGFWEDGRLRYGTCSSPCADAADWRFVTVERVEHADAEGRYEHLIGDFELDALGRPRFAYPAVQPTPMGERGLLRYAACDQDCTERARWRTTTVEAVTRDAVWPYQAALAFHGVLPRVGYFGWNRRTNVLVEGYAECSRDCEQARGWDALTLPGTPAGPHGVTLATHGGAVHVAYPNEATGVHYTRCQSDCLDPASWSVPALAWAHAHAFSPDLAVTASGAPLMAVLGIGTTPLPDGRGGRAAPEHLYTVQCAQASLCVTPAGWRATHLAHTGQLVDPHALAVRGRQAIVAYSPWKGFDRVGVTWCARECGPQEPVHVPRRTP